MRGCPLVSVVECRLTTLQMHTGEKLEKTWCKFMGITVKAPWVCWSRGHNGSITGIQYLSMYVQLGHLSSPVLSIKIWSLETETYIILSFEKSDGPPCWTGDCCLLISSYLPFSLVGRSLGNTLCYLKQTIIFSPSVSTIAQQKIPLVAMANQTTFPWTGRV